MKNIQNQMTQYNSECMNNSGLSLVNTSHNPQINLDFKEIFSSDKYLRFLKPELLRDNQKIGVAATKQLLGARIINKKEANVLTDCLLIPGVVLRVSKKNSCKVFFCKLLTLENHDNEAHLIVLQNNDIKLVELKNVLGIDAIDQELAFDLFEEKQPFLPTPYSVPAINDEHYGKQSLYRAVA